MRKSPLVPILLLAIAGCGDNPVGPDDSVGPELETVRANLIIDYDRWDLPGEERRAVSVRHVVVEGCKPYDCDFVFESFDNLPQDGPVEISTILACQGDHLDHRIQVTAFGARVFDQASLGTYACTEEPQIVQVRKPLVTGCLTGPCRQIIPADSVR